ncbi:uncharacterized protein LOC129754016 [Uranotaenia lowii]|uniref:uncharacterized protein LOC129754016 n=1 Tax=Uranotaenia lowii TaxID=190385 RepID=UPI00247AE6B7|nr:uncharacterized protein LOC129754016 [Uranotaenia lowii]
MFSVVQFVENNKFKVLAVPSSWVKQNKLLWPKHLSCEKIEQMRESGTEYHGSTKRIPAILFKKFRSFAAAEAAVTTMENKEVSDIEGKKKLLKSAAKRQKVHPQTNYDAMCQVLTQQASSSASSYPAPPKTQPASSSTSASYPAHPKTQQASSSQPSQPAPPNFQNTQQVVTGFASHQSQMNAPKGPKMEIPTVPEDFLYSTELVQYPDAVGNLSLHSSNNVYYIETPPIANEEIIETANITDNSNVHTQASLNEELKRFIATTVKGTVSESIHKAVQTTIPAIVQATVDRCMKEGFQEGFSRMAVLMEMQKPTSSVNSVQNSVLDCAEKHVLIKDEEDLAEWNIRLANREVFTCYVDYFAKIVIPNAYYGRGDNAFYALVDCLFTRDFWKQFTWTGISRGDKCKRGFREYGNVTQLLLHIIQVGDPTYNANMIEAFCKTKLFRHCKQRSESRLLRKSTVRPGRIRKDVNESNGKARVVKEQTTMKEGTEEEQSEEETEIEIDDGGILEEENYNEPQIDND